MAVYVDGTFDLLHLGHVDFLKRAKKMGDRMIVGVIGDKNVKSYKRKPIISCQERAEMLRNLSCVDFVIEDCPFMPIPGSFLDTWNIKAVVYAGELNDWAIHYRVPLSRGIMHVFPYGHGRLSTSKIIQRIQTRVE